MNRRRCLNVLAGSILATMAGLGTRQSFAHGHGGGGRASHYHHDHDDHGDHRHDCRDTEEANKTECQDHNGDWEATE